MQLISFHLVFIECRQCDALNPLEILFLHCRLRLIWMRRRPRYFARKQREKYCNKSFPLVCITMKPSKVQRQDSHSSQILGTNRSAGCTQPENRDHFLSDRNIKWWPGFLWPPPWTFVLGTAFRSTCNVKSCRCQPSLASAIEVLEPNCLPQPDAF